MNLGIVGTGNMGSTLIEGIYSTYDNDISIFACNRTDGKIEALHARFPQLNVCGKIEVVIEKSSVLIFAVPFSFIQRLPSSVIGLLQENQPLILALCGYAPIRLLQKYLPLKVAKAYPNINWAVRAGVTIVHFGMEFNPEDKEPIINLLARVGDVYEVSEDQFRPLSNLISCGPALWIKMIDLFIEANVKKYGIDPIFGFELAQKTIYGTFRLMKEKGYSVDQIIKKVAGPGGITEIGLDCFNRSLPEIFADAIEKISLRDRERIQRIETEEIGRV